MRVLRLACVGLMVACSSRNGPSGPSIKQEGSSVIVAGNQSTCLVTQSGSAYCWGFDTVGALGTGTTGGVQLTPVAVAGNHTYSALSGGEYFRCGLAGALPLCWGQTLFGASHGYLYSDSAPTLVTLGIPALATIAAGPSHACGLTQSGMAFCWGENYFGQLGVGDTLPEATAVPVTGEFRWTAIVVGFWHTCALTAADSTAFCWGENLAGELGSPPDSVPLATTPRPVAGYKFTSLAAGSLYTCGLTATGAVYCWGWNYAGNLGDGTTTNRTAPTPVSQSDLVFKSIFAASPNSILLTTCGITISNALYCWGWGGYGQLGNPGAPLVNCGSISNPAQCSSLVPFPVAGGLQFATASVGTTHACGVTLASVAYCWGMNDHGQLGDGSTSESAAPVAVSGNLIAKERRAMGLTRSASR